jgi:DNA-binding MarR family transcriptional regulator
VTDDQAAFVEAMGRYLGQYGLPPMAGRMWGWLLVCDPVEQTAGQLAEALHASRGSISGTGRMLESAGFIRRSTRRGDRREYFSAPIGAFRALIDSAGATYRRFREIAQLGIAAVGDLPPPARARIEEVAAFAAFVEREMPTLVERFHEESATTTQASGTTVQRQPEAITA